MQVVYSEDHRRHDPKTYFRGGGFHEHPEMPARADNIAAALSAAGYDILPPEDFGPGPRAAVHTPEYLHFLETIVERWRADGFTSEEVVPNVHPGRHMAGLPEGTVGQLGYFTTDMSAPIGPETWQAARTASDVTLTATRRVLDGAREAYALCRPPGHHAFADQAGGFCFLNNIAIAAQYARDHGAARAAIVDVDVHHGNGTQGIFYRRGDVLTVSLHCDPTNFYPFFAGYGHERGEDAGRGVNANFPLPRGTGDNAYLVALDEALALVRSFAPEILFVALGLDGYEKDPFEGFRITTAGFGRIAQALGELGLPTVLVQEGGYNCADLGRNVESFLTGFAEGR
ncbi:MAG: histone deacetylase family protein [Alphaproteobacteria bacterium]|nr:histone deacetylase family protein [Alphaproteobacteria bacterium]